MEPLAAPRHDDAEILRAAARGEPEAARVLLDDFMPVVYGFVLARVGGNEAAAEDVMQETVVEAIRSARSFRGDAQLTTWLCVIARRRLARFFERERKQAAAAAGLTVVEESSSFSADERDLVVQALGKLPPLHRQVLVLKYLDLMTVDEVAKEMSRPRVQVQSLLQRAREGFRKALETGNG